MSLPTHVEEIVNIYHVTEAVQAMELLTVDSSIVVVGALTRCVLLHNQPLNKNECKSQTPSTSNIKPL